MHDISNVLLDFRAQRPTIAHTEALRRSLESMLFRNFVTNPDVTAAAELLARAFLGDSHPFDMTKLRADSRPYASNILSIADGVRSGTFAEAQLWQTTSAPDSVDCLVTQLAEWPLFKVLNFALMSAIPAKRRVAIVTSIRNEGVSIVEWIAHHRAMGFDDIFVYSNNNTDGSTDLLQKLAGNGIIRFIDNTVGTEVPPQLKAYEHATHLLPALRQYQWVFFLDADEFFIPRCEPSFSVDDFFAKLHAELGERLPSAISFNWKWFGSENAFEKTDGLLLRRFMHSIHNAHVKTLVQINCVLSMQHLHCPVMFKDCSTVDSKFQPVGPIATQVTPNYGSGQINHYWNKSFQEFVIKKARGRGAVGSNGVQRDYSTFFDWGANGRRGNYDPPPDLVIRRTQGAYEQLLEIPGVREDLAKVNEAFVRQVGEIDKIENLKLIYDRRGRSQAAEVSNVAAAALST